MFAMEPVYLSAVFVLLAGMIVASLFAMAGTVLFMLLLRRIVLKSALVGPLTFLGFMVANLAYRVACSSQHRI